MASFAISYKFVLVCRGICIRHKAAKPSGVGRYASGQKRCQICELFIKWDGPWCPCCGYRLRAKPRTLKYKTKLKRSLDTISIGQEALRTKGSIVSPVAEVTLLLSGKL